MIENLCTNYGEQICQIKTKNDRDRPPLTFFSFPTIERLAENPVKLEAKLRDLGFGYRAGYVAKTAAKVRDKGGEEYLFGLRNLDYDQSKSELLQLTGVGPKVRRYFIELLSRLCFLTKSTSSFSSVLRTYILQ